MTSDKRNEALRQALQDKIRTFSRIEKVFYSTLLVTAIVMAISVVYLQGRNQEIQQEISAINRQIKEKEVEFNNAKQEVNELTRLERIAQIVQKSNITTQNGNLQKVD